jgi:hypothetical protein
MAFNEVLGTGYIPRANPAIQRISTTTTITGETSSTFTLTINDDMASDFLQVSASFERQGVSATAEPKFILKRNNLEIDRYVYDSTIGSIETNLGIKTIYTFAQQRPDLLQRGDTISLEISQVNTAGAEANDWTVNIGVFGSFI